MPIRRLQQTHVEFSSSPPQPPFLISGSCQRGEERLPDAAPRPGHGTYTAPAFCAYSQESLDSGTVRAADSIALALAAVPSRMRPAMPCVMQARRNKL